MSTVCASSVFLPSCRNTILNQSACIFSLGYFVKTIIYFRLQLIGQVPILFLLQFIKIRYVLFFLSNAQMKMVPDQRKQDL